MGASSASTAYRCGSNFAVALHEITHPSSEEAECVYYKKPIGNLSGLQRFPLRWFWFMSFLSGAVPNKNHKLKQNIIGAQTRCLPALFPQALQRRVMGAWRRREKREKTHCRDPGVLQPRHDRAGAIERTLVVSACARGIWPAGTMGRREVAIGNGLKLACMQSAHAECRQALYTRRYALQLIATCMACACMVTAQTEAVEAAPRAPILCFVLF